jgi:hypothetical protein
MATGRIGTTPVLQVRWSKAPSAGTTSLSGLDDNSVSLVYSVGYEAVYQNGVLLSRGNDYTATNGTTITLTTATVAGDIIEVFANQTIPLTDTYSQTVANGKFINNTLTTTTGDIIYASAANTPARLGIGSTSQVLTVSGGVPTWAAPSATTTWTAYTPTTSNITVGNGSLTAEYFKQGTFVAFRLRFRLGSTSAISGASYVRLPFEASDANRGVVGFANLYDDSANMPFAGMLYISATQDMYIRAIKSDGTYANSADTSSTIPFTWATDDSITTQFVYESV